MSHHLCSLLFAFCITTSNAQEQKPTKNETLEWIKGKIVDPANYPEGKLIKDNSIINDFSFTYDGCTIQYSFKVDTKGNQVVRIQKVDLKDIELCEISNDSTLTLKSQYHQSLVKNWWIGDGFPFHTTEGTAMTFDTFTIFSTEKYAKRIQKAFNHLLPLCGGGKKTEKF